MTKAPLAFRTISEVSETLDVPQHVLRFWEGKFPQIKPLKRAGGRRYYRPEDIELLRGVRALLYAEGYTIKGVQKLLRTAGGRYVCDIGRYGVKRAGRSAGAWDGAPADLIHAPPDEAGEPPNWRTAPPDDEDDETDGEDLEIGVAEASGEGGEDDAPAPGLDARRAKLESALQELLALRDILRAVRPKKADAA